MRRIETITILVVALVRMLLVILGVYFWWVYVNPAQQPTALIGAGALAIIIGGATIGPILRDIANGGVMMAEHWYGVGDHVRVDPFWELQGVVERVTLRSTRIRGLNGEVIWINNQYIQGVRVLTKGVRTTALELFVADLNKGLDLIEKANQRLPTGPLMVVRPLHIMGETQVGPQLWHVTAVGETAPGREWLLQNYAITLLQEMDADNKHPILKTDPIARDADSVAEQSFSRTVQNARKSPLERKHLPLPESIAKQVAAAKKVAIAAEKRATAAGRAHSRRNKKIQ